jgi:hypothetical protein
MISHPNLDLVSIIKGKNFEVLGNLTSKISWHPIL